MSLGCKESASNTENNIISMLTYEYCLLNCLNLPPAHMATLEVQVAFVPAVPPEAQRKLMEEKDD